MHPTDPDATRRRRIFSNRMMSLFFLGGAVIAAGLFLYGKKGPSGNGAADECRGSAEIAAKMTPFIRGEVAAMQVAKTPKRLPPISFASPAGQKSMIDVGGKTVLFNLWATWCVPCRAEMPALDHLQKTLGGDQFEVLALNMDTRNPEKVPQWLKENGIAALALYTDAEGKAFQTLRKESLVTGLPTTFLVDAKGCVLGGMAGPAEWDSADALALLSSVIEAGRSK